MREVIAVFLQVMEALKTMAKHGITHNDMHWGNVFVQRCNHSFVVGEVSVESQFIVKVFDWDRAVCNDQTCVDTRTPRTMKYFNKAHIREYTAGYDLVGFFKSFDANMEKDFYLADGTHGAKDNSWVWARVTRVDFDNFFKNPMAWLLSEMLDPMAELFNSKPSLADQKHAYHSNPCLTNPTDLDDDRSPQSPQSPQGPPGPQGPQGSEAPADRFDSGWNKLEFTGDGKSRKYPSNCMERWTDDVEVPTPEDISYTLLQCLRWAQCDPETPEYMIAGRHVFYDTELKGKPDLLRQFVPFGASVVGEHASHITLQARLRNKSHNSPVVSVRARPMKFWQYKDQLIECEPRDYDAMDSVLNIIRKELLGGGCQYFVFPFVAWCEPFQYSHSVEVLLKDGKLSEIESAVMQTLVVGGDWKTEDNSMLRYTIEEDMASSSTRTLGEWLLPEHRYQSVKWLTRGSVHEHWGHVLHDCIMVLMQAVLAIQRLEALEVTHGGMGKFQNIFVQECENSFWVGNNLLESQYLVKIGGWAAESDVLNTEVATGFKRGTDMTHFLATLRLQLPMVMGGVADDCETTYTVPMRNMIKSLDRAITAERAMAPGTAAWAVNDIDVCDVVKKFLYSKLGAAVLSNTTPGRYFKQLAADFKTTASPRVTWCRVLEFWMQALQETCVFSFPCMAHVLKYASTYRISVGEAEMTIPAHVRLTRAIGAEKTTVEKVMVLHVFNMLVSLQTKADERLVQDMVEGRTHEQLYKEQCKIKYVMVLMKECYTSLGYDREVDPRKLLMKTLYQHWIVASSKKLLINPAHRSAARLNMGVTRREADRIAAEANAIGEGEINMEVDEDGDDINAPLVRARLAHTDNTANRDAAVKNLSEMEMALDKAVQDAHLARIAAYRAVVSEIDATEDAKAQTEAVRDEALFMLTNTRISVKDAEVSMTEPDQGARDTEDAQKAQEARDKLDVRNAIAAMDAAWDAANAAHAAKYTHTGDLMKSLLLNVIDEVIVV